MGAWTRRLLVVGLGLQVAAEVFFEERFDKADWEQRWVSSSWKAGNGPAGKFEWSAGKWSADETEQKGIRTPNDMHYHSISAKLATPFSNKGKELVVQFSVKHEEQEFSFCGGGYIKILGSDLDQATFGGDTPYKIMFGPDICGYDIARVHLIFNYKDQNLLRRPDIPLDYDEKNEHTHLYTLVLKPDNTYAVYLNQKEKSAGSLHQFWDFPNKTNDDSADRKPQDWVDLKKINDPNQKKPEDWVDVRRIRDPSATIPAEWDEEEDGIYEAPLIDNPKYKGEWFANQIDNPDYKGEWRPRQIENPDYVEEVYVFDDIGAVGFELWTVNKGSVFDNILITDSFDHAKKVGEKVMELAHKEKDAKKKWDKANGKDGGDALADAGNSDGGDEDEDDHAETIEVDGKQEL